MTALAPFPVWRVWVRRHERTLAALWLAAVGLLLLALAIPRTREAVLYRVQALSDRWDARWTSRLAWGDSLVANGRNAAAAAYLERLDRAFPARNVRHVRDKQREHLLYLLARSYEALGHKRQAMATYNRLVAFDSLNYYNHFLRATAAERLLSGWAIAPEARDGYASTLKIFPNHLPSVRGYIRYFSDRSDWHPVVDAFHAYLDAYLAQNVTVRIGDSLVSVMVPVDGKPHPVSVAMNAPSAVIRISADGFPFAVDSAVVLPALRVGVAGPQTVTPLRLAGSGGLESNDAGAWRPVADSGALAYALAPASAGAELRFVVRLFKPVDRALWEMVALSHRNNMDHAGIPLDAARVVVFPNAAAADAVLEHLPSARDGLPPLPARP